MLLKRTECIELDLSLFFSKIKKGQKHVSDTYFGEPFNVTIKYIGFIFCFAKRGLEKPVYLTVLFSCKFTLLPITVPVSKYRDQNQTTPTSQRFTHIYWSIEVHGINVYSRQLRQVNSYEPIHL